MIDGWDGKASRSGNPATTSGTSESSARSEPWLPPPRWWMPPESANSQPGAAETMTSPAVAHRTAPSSRSSAFG